MKLKVVFVLVIMALALVFLFANKKDENKVTYDVETSKVDIEDKEEENIEKEVYEPIPIAENSGMLFETKKEAKDWVKSKGISKYEIIQCEWKWEKGYKNHGIDNEILYTVKIK